MKFERKKNEGKIPSDSMADIAFLLIIFFMLTTTFSVNKGFDFGVPPLEKSSEESESRPALTVIVDTIGDVERNYRVVVVDEQGNQRDFNKGSLRELFGWMDQAFDDVYTQQPDMWFKLPLYILVRRDSPVEGFVDVWQEVKRLEDKWGPRIPGAEKKLATHIPHVDQVEKILEQYIAQGKITL